MAFSTVYLILLGFLLMCSSPSHGVPIRGNVIPARERERERERGTL